MRIGVDFDNTIVNFDPLFYSSAVRQKLVPKKTKPSKNGVRDFLRAQGRNDDWTRLQGFVYGRRIKDAQPFPGVKPFFSKAVAQGHSIFIVSHKTKRSALTPVYDLHSPARAWLKSQGFSARAFFETSMEKKLRRLIKLDCDVFIDDLLEFLTHPDFPEPINRILFDPQKHHLGCGLNRVQSWEEVSERLLV